MNNNGQGDHSDSFYGSQMKVELIGPKLFELDERGQQPTRIGTAFPDYGVLYTQAPAIHACQRLGFVERLNAQRANQGLPKLTLEEEEKISGRSVDLII